MTLCQLFVFFFMMTGITPGKCGHGSRCPLHRALGQKSIVVPGMCFTTLMGGVDYYDEEGRHIYHDPNTTTCSFSCTVGTPKIEWLGGGYGIMHEPPSHSWSE